jgi:adenylate kinase family enzyme
MNQRFVVMGTTGTGKTTFAKCLAEKLKVPHIQGDKFVVFPNWVIRKPEEFVTDLDQVASEAAWLFDGCYSGDSMASIWLRVETVIWLDYSRWRVHWQLLKRTFQNVVTQREVYNGNRETWCSAFFNRHSILLSSLKEYDRHRHEFLDIEKKLRKMGKDVFVFKSPKEAQAYLAGIKCLQLKSNSVVKQL